MGNSNTGIFFFFQKSIGYDGSGDFLSSVHYRHISLDYHHISVESKRVFHFLNHGNDFAYCTRGSSNGRNLLCGWSARFRDAFLDDGGEFKFKLNFRDFNFIHIDDGWSICFIRFILVQF